MVRRVSRQSFRKKNVIQAASSISASNHSIESLCVWVCVCVRFLMWFWIHFGVSECHYIHASKFYTNGDLKPTPKCSVLILRAYWYCVDYLFHCVCVCVCQDQDMAEEVDVVVVGSCMTDLVRYVYASNVIKIICTWQALWPWLTLIHMEQYTDSAVFKRSGSSFKISGSRGSFH